MAPRYDERRGQIGAWLFIIQTLGARGYRFGFLPFFLEKKALIYFTSDVHLGAQCHNNPLAVEKHLVAWLDAISADAEAIYFLGDIFDYWYEYRHVVPKGYVRFLGKVASLTDRGIKVYFLAGNHDVWMYDYFRQELGAEVLHKAIEVNLKGKYFRLAHGDCEYAERSLKEKFLYKLFRNRGLQVLYSAIHPRWSVGFATSCSTQSRRAGIEQEYNQTPLPINQEWLIEWVQRHSREYPTVTFFLFGHRHRAIDVTIANKRVVVLGGWLQGEASYASWDGEHLVLHKSPLTKEEYSQRIKRSPIVRLLSSLSRKPYSETFE